MISIQDASLEDVLCRLQSLLLATQGEDQARLCRQVRRLVDKVQHIRSARDLELNGASSPMLCMTQECPSSPKFVCPTGVDEHSAAEITHRSHDNAVETIAPLPVPLIEPAVSQVRTSRTALQRPASQSQVRISNTKTHSKESRVSSGITKAQSRPIGSEYANRKLPPRRRLPAGPQAPKRTRKQKTQHDLPVKLHAEPKESDAMEQIARSTKLCTEVTRLLAVDPVKLLEGIVPDGREDTILTDYINASARQKDRFILRMLACLEIAREEQKHMKRYDNRASYVAARYSNVDAATNAIRRGEDLLIVYNKGPGLVLPLVKQSQRLRKAEMCWEDLATALETAWADRLTQLNAWFSQAETFYRSLREPTHDVLLLVCEKLSPFHEIVIQRGLRPTRIWTREGRIGTRQPEDLGITNELLSYRDSLPQVLNWLEARGLACREGETWSVTPDTAIRQRQQNSQLDWRGQAIRLLVQGAPQGPTLDNKTKQVAQHYISIFKRIDIEHLEEIWYESAAALLLLHRHAKETWTNDLSVVDRLLLSRPVGDLHFWLWRLYVRKRRAPAIPEQLAEFDKLCSDPKLCPRDWCAGGQFIIAHADEHTKTPEGTLAGAQAILDRWEPRFGSPLEKLTEHRKQIVVAKNLSWQGNDDAARKILEILSVCEIKEDTFWNKMSLLQLDLSLDLKHLDDSSVVSIVPGRRDTLRRLVEGEAHFQDGCFAESLQCFQAALRSGPSNADLVTAMFGVAKALSSMRSDAAKAIRAWNELIEHCRVLEWKGLTMKLAVFSRELVARDLVAAERALAELQLLEPAFWVRRSHRWYTMQLAELRDLTQLVAPSLFDIGEGDRMSF